MANPIKYTTATQSNSIKAGNFAVGVNKGGYGPTNVTYFYNGKTPNVGGYTVYVANGTASPSPFVASNDSVLITLSNQLGGSGITTISAALNFFNSSSTILCTNMDYPNIVTSGLVLNLDAAYTPSYPKNGTTWKDLSGYGNNGTFVGSGPTYDSSNFGSLVFTSSANQHVTSSTPISLTNSVTLSSWFKFSSQPNTIMRFVTVDNEIACIRKNGSNAEFFVKIGGTIKILNSSQTFTNNVWYNMVGTYLSGGPGIAPVCAIYINGSQLVGTFSISGTLDSSSGYKISSEAASETMVGNISNAMIYNKVLSSTEILQNYYAGLQRFIPTNGLVMSLDAENTDKRVSLPSVAYDMSGNNNNGTMLNSISLSTIGRTSFVLDGVNYQISTPYSSTFDFSLAQTIILWLKPGTGATASRRNPYSQAYGGSGTITQETSGNFTYYFGTAGIDSIPYTGIGASFTVATNELAFIAVTRDQVTNTVNWYKNGSFVTSSNAGGYTTTNNGSLPIKIGTGYAGSFVGNIGQTFVYNRALTSTEISTIYNATRSRYGL